MILYARSTKEAPAAKRLECLCELQEARCWGCLYILKVCNHLYPFQLLWFFFLKSFYWLLKWVIWNSRGENGELRVGVRRALRQQSNIPSSVISSHSMHLGVLATAWHAIQTGTMFTVYYKPRYVIGTKYFTTLMQLACRNIG